MGGLHGLAIYFLEKIQIFQGPFSCLEQEVDRILYTSTPLKSHLKLTANSYANQV